MKEEKFQHQREMAPKYNFDYWRLYDKSVG